MIVLAFCQFNSPVQLSNSKCTLNVSYIITQYVYKTHLSYIFVSEVTRQITKRAEHSMDLQLTATLCALLLLITTFSLRNLTANNFKNIYLLNGILSKSSLTCFASIADHFIFKIWFANV